MIKTIDGAAFSRMMLSAAAEIDLNKQKVNELNVFPVPDGDTGTNMSMTLSAASTELRKADGITLTKAADKTASALLRGARGNSGVILSLLFRGFSKSLKGKLEADGKDFAAALTAGVEAAYKAVMKPAEGTILTVSRLTADAARDLAEENNEIEYVLQHCLDTAHAALDNTVNQNPVLKKAGVVDAGGMGFCLILRGMLESLRGNDIVCEDTGATNEEADFGIFDSEDITFAFDTVFIVRKREDITSLDPLREYLGLCDGALAGTTREITTLLASLADKAAEAGKEFINIFYGADIQEPDAEAALELFRQHAPDAEVNLVSGGQPIYYYLISAE